MSYRPITDIWILARPKVKYYGAYPSGFLERAKPLIGCGTINSFVMHVCGGHAKQYPYDKGFLGFGTCDMTMDIDPETQPDCLGDALSESTWPHNRIPDGIICDPPYTLDDAAHYKVPNFPSANGLLRVCLSHVPVGGMVGMLHYVVPQPPKTAKFIACVGVFVGYNNRMRAFSVFQRRQ